MAQNNTGRRGFIKKALIATGGIILAPNFISCSNDDDSFQEDYDESQLTNKNFDQGVASFDPTSSSVIIWTRYANANSEIIWEVSTDATFDTTLRSGKIITETSRDLTIAVELAELEPDQKLYYRFINSDDNAISVVGETITLPEQASEVKLAVCSCSNYQAGLFNAYDAMATSEADIIVHLGDYFYEYEAGGYGASVENAFLNRLHEPAHEILSLEDYRTRYKQYRSDKSLQLAHQKKPFICVWDDHEIANDTYKDGAENHDEATEGSFETRKQNALQAYSEFLPFSQLSAGKNDIIYRSINIGNLVNLVMLDTRVIGRDKQLNIADYFTATGFDGLAFQTALSDPSRSLLGAEQLSWVTNQLQGNNAKWQVLGQQVLMGNMYIPAELLMAFGSENFATTLTELTTIKVRLQQGDPTLTDAEKARVNTVIPYNLDAWDGYPVDREIIYNALSGKKLVTLAGDTHNAWHNVLTSQQGTEVGVELATAGVSSPGFETYLGATSPEMIAGFEQAMTTLVDGLSYFDASRRGFMMATFTSTEVKSEWIFLDTILSESYTTTIGHTATFA
ncbi:alkaline phosphatase D family protein [Tamlana sp. 2_MG-2023]|uniref:alkaline phosphatase D family protein n=1 Tax=unclassified Tamlana TaxID=2614803 RepID=UPI0026E1A250|nr:MULTISPECIES: alkaline phosphatase D family protein [unclassified Tamlana]MDO6760358.1 alkaline phosphatase D family protein [Tamlana sp. 2_MG-2023]MDO6789944.1 alkaline phosphatase D family protein [Tamlana sp. 1_MG-2023]